MKNNVAFIIAVLFSFTLPPAWSADTSASLKNDPYYTSLMQIGVRKSQGKAFKSLINQYTQDRSKAINREKNSSVERNFTLEVKKIRNKKAKAFSEEMKALLTTEQYQRFHAFHAELDKKLLRNENSGGGYETESGFNQNTHY
jgi:arginyl-tRNA--protein-N-Asp/Glu arginylyltransferase